MTLNKHLWPHYTLAIAAIACSVVSIFALAEMGAPSWTTPLNILSVVLVLLAMKARGRHPNARDS